MALCQWFFYAFIIYWLDRYEKEPGVLLGGVFTWGALVAAISAFAFNTILGVGIYLVTGSEMLSEWSTGSLVAPIIEETVKGFAVLLIFLAFRSEFDSLLDGVVYAAITALGFAATENAYYIYSYGFLENGWSGIISVSLIRILVVGWQHPFFTAFFGIGLATARTTTKKWLKILAPFSGWLVAVLAHSVHNTIASIGSSIICIFGSLLDWSGWLAMLIFIFWTISQEKKMIQQYLKDEMINNVITSRQYETALSSWNRNLEMLKSLTRGSLRITARFYQICAELSHKKSQLEKFGEEKNNSQIIFELRKELLQLSPSISIE